MYPSYPVMNNLDSEPDSYPAATFDLPSLDPLLINAVTLGPDKINIAYTGLNKRYWLASSSGTVVSLRFSEGDSWSEPVEAFTAQHKIKEMSIAFDQAGNPTIAYQVSGSELCLWFYNSEIGGYDTLSLGIGRSPKIAFDYLSTPSNPNSDVILFYVNANNEAATRLQRERFSVEHLPGVYYSDLKLISAGKNQSNKYQVVYQYHDENYVPPPPQPPIPPEFTGDYVYMQGGATQFGLEKPLINSAQHDDISLAFNLYRMDGVLAGLNPTWGAYGIPIFCEGGQTTIYPIPLSYNTGFHFDINNTGAGYLREYKLLAASKFHLSFMYIEKVLYLVLVINGRKHTEVMPFVLSDGRWAVSIIGSVLTVKKGEAILFTTEVQRGTDINEEQPKPGRFGAYTLGPLYRMWRQNFGGALYAITANIAGVETHYPLMTYNSQTQESIPPGNNISIYNYKPANWKYIAV